MSSDSSPTISHSDFVAIDKIPMLETIHEISSSETISQGNQSCSIMHDSSNISAAHSSINFPLTEQCIVRTYASYHEQPIEEIKENTKNDWTLCIPIPIPDLLNPTLTSLIYSLKYATTHDKGNSTIQTDTILTTKKCSAGITSCPITPCVYLPSRSPYGPRLVDENSSIWLSSISAIKCNSGNSQWSHYVDQHSITSNVRIVGASNLYLMFHVYEYPTAKTTRCLSIQISATWLDVFEAKIMREVEAKEQMHKGSGQGTLVIIPGTLGE